MKNRNQLINNIRTILGNETPEGFFLSVGLSEVPNYLQQDTPAKYPQIRITPFITDEYITKTEKQIEDYLKIETKIYKAEFQIDIYSKNIPQLNEIYSTLIQRIEGFLEPKMLSYNYDPISTQETNNYYFNPEYTIEFSTISKITIENQKLKKVDSQDKLINNTWYLGNDGLYIKTDLPIQKIKILTLIDGFIFPNGDTVFDRGMYGFIITAYRHLSELEINEVERISFDIKLTYSIDKEVKLGPIIESIGQEIKTDG